MKTIILWLMKIHLKKVKSDKDKKENIIIARAYEMMIKSYETTIMFLDAE